MRAIGSVAPARPRASCVSVARSKPPYTAFVLSGGASLGALHVGMLRALFERGIAADVLIGTGLGALNAAFLASRPQTPATAAELARVWCSIHREDVFPVSVRTLVSGFSGQRDHLVSDLALRRQVRRHIEFEDLAEASVPLHLLAFDVIAGCEELLSEGPALDSIAAAAALPGVFPPVPIGERRLIDGSVVNNTPISHAVALGAERIYILPTHERWHPLGRAPCGALDAAIYGLGLHVDGRLKADIDRYSSDAELIPLPAPNSLPVQPTDFDHARRLISEAHTASRDLLARDDAGRKRLSLVASNADQCALERVS
jgi:NTE family protein